MYGTYETKLKKELFQAVCKDIGKINSILLTIFVILKLTDKVAWSWAWVLAPFWIPASLFLISLTVAIIATVIKNRR